MTVLPPPSVCVCAHTCVCSCMHCMSAFLWYVPVCADGCMSVYLCMWRPEVTSSALFNYFAPYLLKWSLSPNLELAGLVRLAGQCRDLTVSISSALGLQASSTTPRFLCGFQGYELRSLGLHRKHLTLLGRHPPSPNFSILENMLSFSCSWQRNIY